MTSLSDKAVDIYQEMVEPLMIAINYDSQMTKGHIYEADELFRLAISMQIYALAKGKTIKIDPETQLVILE